MSSSEAETRVEAEATAGGREPELEATLVEGRVIRMHGFRGTWQHVAREDARWMLGLLGEIRQAIALVRSTLERVELDGTVYWLAEGAVDARSLDGAIQLLPAFDECLIAYQDRAAFVEAAHTRKINAGGGILKPIILLGGRAVGTWRRTLAKGGLSVEPRPFRRCTAPERETLVAATERYAAFVGHEARARSSQ